MDVRSVAMMFGSLMIGVVTIVTTVGCTPSKTPEYACPAGVPWVSDDYANGKWVPGHCLGYPAQ